GRDLVDGGLLAPVPIAATRQVHSDLVVAVDVNGAPAIRRPTRETRPVISATPTGEVEGYRARIAGWFESFASGFGEPRGQPVENEDRPGLIDLMGRALDTMQAQIARMQLALDPPDVLIRMPRDRGAFYEFWRASELIAHGRDSAAAALDAYESRGVSGNDRPWR